MSHSNFQQIVASPSLPTTTVTSILPANASPSIRPAGTQSPLRVVGKVPGSTMTFSTSKIPGFELSLSHSIGICHALSPFTFASLFAETHLCSFQLWSLACCRKVRSNLRNLYRRHRPRKIHQVRGPNGVFPLGPD